MATFESERIQEQQRGDFMRLKTNQAELVAQVQDWADRATALHGDVASEPDKQNEILGLRSDLIAQLKTILAIP